jgi:hypothetical protein
VVGRVGRVAHAFIFSSPFRNCGCPVLAFFARAGTMQPNTALRLCLNPVAHVFIVPALCRVRKGRGTHRGGDSKEIKAWATRPTILP